MASLILVTAFLLLYVSPFTLASPHGILDLPRPTATLTQGVVVGTVSYLPSASTPIVNQYLGIPFAQSPTRFLPPQDPLPWNSSWDASYLRPSCHQHFPSEEFRPIFNNPPLPESEDCLYLSVFTPLTSTQRSSLPVLFWIPGGSFQLGPGRLPEYDGSSLAANQGVIVVTINYKTNVFGFPGSPDIPFHQRNVGFLDQQKALNWVNQNIRAFGGDPSKVTIFGESSGGYAVKQLLINPPSPPQFRAAIMQSQAFGAASDNEKSWTILAKELGCNNTSSGLSEMDCLKVAPAKLIISVLDSNGIGFMPIVDNTTNGPSFDDALTQELVANVPILIGTNADEGTVLTSVLPPPEVMLDGIFGNDTASKSLARSIYPLNVTSNELKSRILTDHTYTCTTSAIAISTAHSGQRAWRYFFNASFANNQPLPGAGAWHTSEIPIVFGTYRRDNQTTVEQVQLSRSMQQAWGNFAKDPENGPGWARVGTSAQDLRLFDTSGAVCGRSIDADVVDGVCAYYDSAILAGCL